MAGKSRVRVQRERTPGYVGRGRRLSARERSPGNRGAHYSVAAVQELFRHGDAPEAILIVRSQRSRLSPLSTGFGVTPQSFQGKSHQIAPIGVAGIEIESAPIFDQGLAGFALQMQRQATAQVLVRSKRAEIGASGLGWGFPNGPGLLTQIVGSEVLYSIMGYHVRHPLILF